MCGGGADQLVRIRLEAQRGKAAALLAVEKADTSTACYRHK